MLKKIILLGVLLITISLTFYLKPDYLIYQSEMDKSKNLIKVIEKFKVQFNRVPDNSEVYGLMKKIGLSPDESCPCYYKENESTYTVYFGSVLGNSIAYNSVTRRWVDL
ncbi:MAG: hypothetical protein GY714_09455 [Desulfobacterales bacterium]|nr:hypothetical protein [Desulfobacterales bacterium]MCP4161436.1 hypothetical protein [Deltaproteobacteria bacterium]